MKATPHKLLFLLLLVLGCFSCSTDDIGQFDEFVIESENNPNKFRQLTFLVSLRDSQHGYLNLASVDSMEMYVNSKYWGTFSSEPADTVGKTDRIVNNIRYSDEPVNYLFVAPYRLKTDKLETAGDVVQYLNDRIVLTPGDYISEIKEVKYQNLAGNWITAKTRIYSVFTVKENAASAYLGNLVIPVK